MLSLRQRVRDDPGGLRRAIGDAEIVVGLGALVAGGPFGAFFALVAAMAALHKVCEFTLHGKLVCLGGDRCAIGRVASFETVDDKSGPDRIDNDFSINLLLAPYDLAFFTGRGLAESHKLVIEEPNQGFLMKEQPGMPVPVEAAGGQRYAPTFTEFPDKTLITFNPPLGSRGAPYQVPILHCEIEGERLNLVCAALHLPLSLIPGLSKVCRVKIVGIPVGRWVCAFVSALFAPFVLAAIAIAWAAGSNDNREFQNAGALERGEPVVILGRWVWDGGHQGWNEVHPVISVQRLSGVLKKDGPGGSLSWGDFDRLYARWCQHVSEAPPLPLPPPVYKPTGMTPTQETVYSAQMQPENRWVLHPAIDGCAPAAEEPRGPVIG